MANKSLIESMAVQDSFEEVQTTIRVDRHELQVYPFLHEQIAKVSDPKTRVGAFSMSKQGIVFYAFDKESRLVATIDVSPILHTICALFPPDMANVQATSDPVTP